MKKRFMMLFLVSVFCVIAANGNAGGETVFVDNEQIQEYKGRLGKWIFVDTHQDVSNHAARLSSSCKEVYDINCGTSVNSSYFFFPYTDTYLKQLADKGIRRNEISCPADQFIWPLTKSITITSVLGLRWGGFHQGVDMPAQSGTPIYASMGGRVIFSAYTGGYGMIIEIEHRNNFTTKYAHNMVNLVRKGDFVKKGQMIALVGSSGNSTGNHLHFEIRCNDIPLDPLDFFPVNKEVQIPHTLKNWK